MSVSKAKVFTTGGSQAVRLPKAFRLEDGEVAVRRLGNGVLLEPVKQGGAALWARIDAIEVDEPLAYPEQLAMKEFDWDAIWADAEAAPPLSE